MLALLFGQVSATIHAQTPEARSSPSAEAGQLLESADRAYEDEDFGTAYLLYVKAAEALGGIIRTQDPRDPVRTDNVIRAAHAWIRATLSHRAATIGGPNERVQHLEAARALVEDHLKGLVAGSEAYKLTMDQLYELGKALERARSADAAARRAAELAAKQASAPAPEDLGKRGRRGRMASQQAAEQASQAEKSEKKAEEAEAVAADADEAATRQLLEVQQSLLALREQMETNRDRDKDDRKRAALLAGVGVGAGLTAVAAGVSIGLLATAREGGPIHADIVDAAVQSTHVDEYLRASSVCAVADEQADIPVQTQCSRHKKFVTAGAVVSAGAGLFAAVTVTFAVLLAKRSRSTENRASFGVAPVARGAQMTMNLRF